MEHRMTLEDFELLLDRHGATLNRWPVREQRGAMNLLADSPDARALYDDTLALETLLDLAPSEPAPSLSLRTAILAHRPQVTSASLQSPSEPLQPEALQSRRFVRTARTQRRASAGVGAWMHSRWTMPVSALAASLVLGILSGVLMKTSGQTAPSAQAVPSVEQVFTIGLGDQLATLPTKVHAVEDVE